MENNQEIWRNWIAVLHAWGIHEIAATIMDATSPLYFIGAQAIYIGQPFLNIFLSNSQVDAFAELLDNPIEAKNFSNSLRHLSKTFDKRNPSNE